MSTYGDYYYLRGVEEIQRGDIRGALTDLAVACEDNHAEALSLMSQICDQFNDSENSFRYCLRAAEAGSKDAAFNLANRYREGRGTPINIEEAIRWYRVAARAGDPSAFYNLGTLLLNKSLYDDAIKCFAEAEQKGHPKATLWKGIAYERKGNLISAADAYFEAAAKGNTQAMNEIGICYLEGKGTPKSESEAYKWFEKAAKGGNPSGICNYGVCIYKGIGTERNIVEGKLLIEKAAKLGDEHAINLIKTMR